ncbi:MAG TPA: efflux transporter outer membrane subunit [Phenylobacterium sp.]|nr:efflux transporter outer membrane subunit [Phenylobacterium sp.]
MLLGACATHAPSSVPSVPVPASFSKGSSGPVVSVAEWWTAFDDPVLTGLVSHALAASPDVQQTVARVRQAREQEAITRDGHGPQVNASAQASEARLSKNALPSALAGLFSGSPGQSGPSTGLGLPGETFTTYQLGFDASWELDLFGGQRKADKAAHARTDAALWSARDAEVTLTAEVANTYQQYRALQRRLALADETLNTQREALSFLRARARNGLNMASDVRQQERAVEQAAAQRDDLAAQADARLHALSTLLGLAPNALTGELAGAPSTAPVLVEIPPGLPSDLLKRRPDIRAAERQVAAANSDIGAATADLYPKVTLTGALQLASRSLSNLLENDSLQDNASGRIAIPILNRGRLHAMVRLRQAQADEAAAAYRKTVFAALRDVEDGLTRLDADRRRLSQFKAAAAAAQDEADAAAVRYRNGLIAAGDMLTARLTWQTARDAQVQAEAAAAQDIVALYKALGGGWDERRTLTQEDQPSGQGS